MNSEEELLHAAGLLAGQGSTGAARDAGGLHERIARYTQRRAAPSHEPFKVTPEQRAAARALLNGILRDLPADTAWMPKDRALELLGAYGIATAQPELAAEFTASVTPDPTFGMVLRVARTALPHDAAHRLLPISHGEIAKPLAP